MEPVAPLAPERTQTAAELEAAGVSITVRSLGLTAPQVMLSAPPALRAATQAAIAWRMAAMRAQVRVGQRGAPLAVEGYKLPLRAPLSLSVLVETGKRLRRVTTVVSRPVNGLCPSCGEAHAEPGATGDCSLCTAARIGALRAEGRLPAAAPAPAPRDWPTVDEWLTEPLAAQAAAAAHASTAPVPVRWRCATCGAEVESWGAPTEPECGPCEMRRVAVVDMSRLGGGAR